MTTHVFISASVTPRHAAIGSYLIIEGNLDDYSLANVKPKIMPLTLQSPTLALIELAINVLELIPTKNKLVIYTECQNLINLHTLRRSDPRLVFHRNYFDLYKPLLDLMNGATVVKIAQGLDEKSIQTKIYRKVEQLSRNELHKSKL